jgi:hypothetical protein
MGTQKERPVVLNDLYNMLARAFKIVVRVSSMADAATLFRSTDRKDFDDLQRSLLLDPPTEPFHCMCIGSPALYLYGPGDELVELTNHHGLSVRCSLWTSDVRVNNTEKWVSWFDRRGMSGPRQEVEKMSAEQERGKRDWDKWLTAMPKAIVPVWSDSLGQFGRVDIAPLRAALEREVWNETSRILALLQWFGSGAGPWSGYPSYETAAEKLLLEYPTARIVEAIQSSSVGPTQAEGAARLFGGGSFQQRPGGLKEVPDPLKKALWNHVKGTKDTDKLSRAARAFLE